ncbi:MAG: metal ABC transporter substrate-binding protein [Planctomycetota bacterium]|jgi:zinc transport system substrate-binding protein
MRMRIVAVIVALLVALAVLVSGNGPAAPRQPAQVVATIPALAAICAELTADPDAVTVLMPANASPHHYAPRPSALRALNDAKLVVAIGDLDDWLPTTSKPTWRALDTLPPELLQAGTCNADDHANHNHGRDPHIWFDPLLVAELVPSLAEALAQADPAHGEAYHQRASAFQAELQALHTELAATLAVLDGRPLICHHPSLEYFGRRYAIPRLGSVANAAGILLGPRHLLGLIGLPDAARAIVITEPQLDPQPAVAVAREHDLPLVTIDPHGAAASRGGYSAWLRSIAAALVGAR